MLTQRLCCMVLGLCLLQGGLASAAESTATPPPALETATVALATPGWSPPSCTTSRPILPDSRTQKGKWVHLAKVAFEKYFRLPAPPDPASVLHRQGRRRQDLAVDRRRADAGRRRARRCCWSAPTPRRTSTRCSGIELRNTPVPVPGAPGPVGAEHRPRQRGRVLPPARSGADGCGRDREERRPCASSCPAPAPPRSPRSTSSRRSCPTTPGYDHIVFDTAPTGHTCACSACPRPGPGFWPATTAAPRAWGRTRA
jgi:hypothetical protein